LIQDVRPKRDICPTCTRPLRNCICQLACSTNNLVELLVLQHPEETRNAKNTAGLLLLSLKNSQAHAGEVFTADELQKWLYAGNKHPLLLYPDTQDYRALGLAKPQPNDAIKNCPPEQLRLVILDGTWRKSRKMLYLNPGLQTLPRLSLNNPPQSLYTIRKAHSENQLSTLEASCYALQELEQQQVDYTPLLRAMEQFVAQQRTFIPTDN
jgi:DTW domain-containing protein YfiP